MKMTLFGGAVRVIVTTALFACMATAASAQRTAFFPLPQDVQYDAAIPTPRAVLGHDPAERVTAPEDLVRYMYALAEAAPARTRIVEYARSWEGRPLVMLAIGSQERMARVDEIRAGLARLADPRTLTAADEASLVAALPVVTALLHSVHGNEISPAGSSLATAYHLLAARGDAAVDRILRESVVLIDPTQNPDGRARFIAGNLVGAAARPDADPLAAEHDEPWPGGRANHYLFDLNRDWFAHTQPESRGRIRALLDWHPHVVVDLHEMGGNSTFYFPPSAVPGNPFATPQQRQLFELFGRENARVFDDRGWAYFISEIFDSFYPGYGASWPTTQGALGKTFEMASSRGLVLERYDGTHLTYGDGIERNFHAALRTALTSAENRERLLREFVAFRRSAVSDGARGTRAYVIDAMHDAPRVTRFGRMLAANGVEVRRARAPFRAAGRDFAAGSLIVPLDQPAGRLVRNLMDPQVDMDPAFVQRQRERRAQRLRDEIYDVTAWNLPMLWGLQYAAADRAIDAQYDVLAHDPAPPWATPAHLTLRGSAASAPWLAGSAAPLQADRAAGPGALPGTFPVGAPVGVLAAARVGWLLPWGTATAEATVAALAAGIPVNAAGAAFRVDGRSFGTGTAFIRATDLNAEQRDRLAGIVALTGAEAFPVQSGFAEEGISLGSNQMRALRAPRVLLLWDAPTSSLSAGWARWVLERRYGQHATAVRTGSFGRADLGRYDVIVMPAGSYSFGDADVQRLRRWVQDGGTLITMAEATTWAARENVGLLATRAEMRRRETPRTQPGQTIDLLDAITPEQEQPEAISGAIIRVALDPTHVLAAGNMPEIGVMVSGSRIFSPLTLDRGTNVGVYAPLDRLVMSGIVWEEARPQLASRAFLMQQPLGRGRIIGFAEDPNFRGYAEATQLLFINAVLLAPAF